MKDKIEKLNFTIDLIELRKEYEDLKENNLRWTFTDHKDQLHPISILKYEGYDYNNLPYGWALTSPYDIDQPTSPWAITNFAPGTSRRPTNLIKGILKKIYDKIPRTSFEYSITVHPPGAEIVKHTDGNNTLRVHIPIYNNTKFIIDDNGEREYELICDGSAYIIDARYQHRTHNPLESDRVSLIFGIPSESEDEIKLLTGLI